ncbi:MAG TPA: extracellular solute-binding protein [Burkholderiales bacterium]|nr:extracellular solute-binding protein [Burkholderiales bacterium]
MLHRVILRALFLASCVAALATAASARAREDVVVWHALSGPQAAAFQRLAQRFNAAQKEYRVLASARGGLETTFAQALALRRKRGAPHIVQIHESLTDELIAEHLVVPLWQAMQAAKQPFELHALPAVAGAFTDARGRLLALPYTSATPVLYYNRDALRRAKLPAVPPASWYAMPDALAALAAAGSACPFTAGAPASLLLESMSAWHNREFATQDNGFEGDGTRLAFNDRLIVRWVAMLSTWRKSGYFVYAGHPGEAEKRFASGECALLASSSADYPALRTGAAFDLGVAPLPYYEDFDDAPQNTLAGGAAFWLLSGRPAAEYRGAVRFLAFLARPDVQAEWQASTGFVPLTFSAYELARRQGYYLKQPGNEIAVRQLSDKALTEESRPMRIADLARIRGIIDEELEAAWTGTKPPLEALNAAVARGNELLSGAARH